MAGLWTTAGKLRTRPPNARITAVAAICTPLRLSWFEQQAAATGQGRRSASRKAVWNREGKTRKDPLAGASLSPNPIMARRIITEKTGEVVDYDSRNRTGPDLRWTEMFR